MPSGCYDHSCRIKDRIGIRYGRLVVIKFAGRNNFSQLQQLCRCDCGNEKIITGNKLKNNGGTRSCGCLRREVQKKRMGKLTGKNHYRYIDGKYCGRDSKEIFKLKEKRRKKDNYTCQKCGMIQEESIKLYNRKLDVHHIDGDNINNVIENMITYCKDCHKKQRRTK